MFDGSIPLFHHFDWRNPPPQGWNRLDRSAGNRVVPGNSPVDVGANARGPVGLGSLFVANPAVLAGEHTVFFFSCLEPFLFRFGWWKECLFLFHFFCLWTSIFLTFVVDNQGISRLVVETQLVWHWYVGSKIHYSIKSLIFALQCSIFRYPWFWDQIPSFGRFSKKLRQKMGLALGAGIAK